MAKRLAATERHAVSPFDGLSRSVEVCRLAKIPTSRLTDLSESGLWGSGSEMALRPHLVLSSTVRPKPGSLKNLI